MHGVDPLLYLRADPLERGVLDAVIDQAIDLANQMQTNLANRIVATIARSLKG